MTVASAECAAYRGHLLPHLDGLYRAALLLTGGRAAAEHLVLDTFGTVFTTRSGPPPTLSVKAWIYQTLVETFTTSPAAPRPEPGRGGAGGGPPWHRVAAPAGTRAASVAVIEHLPEPVVTRVLRSLPARSRILVYLADAEGFSYREIAVITGAPAADVAPHLHRARTRLRALLTAHLPDDGVTAPAGAGACAAPPAPGRPAAREACAGGSGR
jgi:RNA polymerase sigma-70 factor, ECF subfamily